MVAFTFLVVEAGTTSNTNTSMPDIVPASDLIGVVVPQKEAFEDPESAERVGKRKERCKVRSLVHGKFRGQTVRHFVTRLARGAEV